MMTNRIDAQEISDFIKKEELNSNTKIYLGVDSQAFKHNGVWYADYYMVVVVHRNGRNGCKLFYERITERDFSSDKKKPSYRLMQECYKAADLYAKISEVIIDYEVEIHLDLNPNKKYASSAVINQAIGYIKASCNVLPLVKPDSWAATHCADKLVRMKSK
jgi:predicted RNase H-related nuclease YkuK (DUF458 family)